jgi:hypothetical protein
MDGDTLTTLIVCSVATLPQAQAFVILPATSLQRDSVIFMSNGNFHQLWHQHEGCKARRMVFRLQCDNTAQPEVSQASQFY